MCHYVAKTGSHKHCIFLNNRQGTAPPLPSKDTYPLPPPKTHHVMPSAFYWGGGSSVFADLGASDSTNRTIHHCCEHFPLCKQECACPTHNIKAIDELLLAGSTLSFSGCKTPCGRNFVGINRRINRCDPKCRPTQPVPMHKYHLPSCA